MDTMDYINTLREKAYWSKIVDYQFLSTFWEEFSISDKYGCDGIRKHYVEVFYQWKDNYKFLTELTLVLNLKTWSWFGFNDDLGKTYDELWKLNDAYAMDHLKGDELDYYITTLD